MDDTKLHDTSLEDGEPLSILDKSGEGMQLDPMMGMEVKRKPKRVRIGMGNRNLNYFILTVINYQAFCLCTLIYDKQINKI